MSAIRLNSVTRVHSARRVAIGISLASVSERMRAPRPLSRQRFANLSTLAPELLGSTLSAKQIVPPRDGGAHELRSSAVYKNSLSVPPWRWVGLPPGSHSARSECSSVV